VISFTGPTEAVLSAAPSYRARLLAFPSDKFKELPVVLGINEKPDLGGYTLGLHGLKEQIELVDFAVPVAEGRHVVTCAQLASSVAGLSTTATDGVELAQSTIVYPDAGAEFSYTLPKPALDLIKKMGGGDKIKISESEGLFFFATDSEMISYSKSHAAFPNIAGILGTKGLPTAITFPNKEALNKALSRIRPLCFDKDEPAVFFEYDGATSVALVAVAEQKSTTGDTYRDMSSDVIDVTGTGPACKVKLDIKRLAPFFERATFPVTLFLKSASTVVDLHANGGTPEKSTYRFLLMPMRIPDGVSSQPIPKV
jgi:DNA polymerase III sliding clamp (beta) subunit (PCNA family)